MVRDDDVISPFLRLYVDHVFVLLLIPPSLDDERLDVNFKDGFTAREMIKS